MTKDEALDLALEALEYIYEGANNQGPHTGISWRCVAVKAEAAITAIKQARALDKKAENARELGLDYEPHKGLSEHMAQATNGRVRIDPVTGDVGIGTAPAQPAPVQEPVAWVRLEAWQSGAEWPDDCFTGIPADGLTPLYTTPPAQRQWVGLTDKEIEKGRDQTFSVNNPYCPCDSKTMRKAVRWAEAKLKEKNA